VFLSKLLKNLNKFFLLNLLNVFIFQKCFSDIKFWREYYLKNFLFFLFRLLGISFKSPNLSLSWVKFSFKRDFPWLIILFRIWREILLHKCKLFNTYIISCHWTDTLNNMRHFFCIWIMFNYVLCDSINNKNIHSYFRLIMLLHQWILSFKIFWNHFHFIIKLLFHS